jgi:transposase InsO family protein
MRSRSPKVGFCAWCKRELSQHRREDGERASKIKEVFPSYRGSYGSPGIHGELHAQRLVCAGKRVARLMREQEQAAKRRRHRTITKRRDEGATFARNLIKTWFAHTVSISCNKTLAQATKIG